MIILFGSGLPTPIIAETKDCAKFQPENLENLLNLVNTDLEYIEHYILNNVIIKVKPTTLMLMLTSVAARIH